jgi:hypothetical protein
MKTAEKYADILDALEVLKSADTTAIDKSYVEEILNTLYKEIITIGTLSCGTTSIRYAFSDNSVLTFTRDHVINV